MEIRPAYLSRGLTYYIELVQHNQCENIDIGTLTFKPSQAHPVPVCSASSVAVDVNHLYLSETKTETMTRPSRVVLEDPLVDAILELGGEANPSRVAKFLLKHLNLTLGNTTSRSRKSSCVGGCC